MMDTLLPVPINNIFPSVLSDIRRYQAFNRGRQSIRSEGKTYQEGYLEAVPKISGTVSQPPHRIAQSDSRQKVEST